MQRSLQVGRLRPQEPHIRTLRPCPQRRDSRRAVRTRATARERTLRSRNERRISSNKLAVTKRAASRTRRQPTSGPVRSKYVHACACMTTNATAPPAPAYQRKTRRARGRRRRHRMNTLNSNASAHANSIRYGFAAGSLVSPSVQARLTIAFGAAITTWPCSGRAVGVSGAMRVCGATRPTPLPDWRVEVIRDRSGWRGCPLSRLRIGGAC